MAQKMSFSLDCVYCSSYIKYLLRFEIQFISNSLNQTFFNKYSDILQQLQICQVGEYPYGKIHNVVGSEIPVKKIKKENSRCCYKTYFPVIVSRNGRQNRCFGCIIFLLCKHKSSHTSWLNWHNSLL